MAYFKLRTPPDLGCLGSLLFHNDQNPPPFHRISVFARFEDPPNHQITQAKLCNYLTIFAVALARENALKIVLNPWGTAYRVVMEKVKGASTTADLPKSSSFCTALDVFAIPVLTKVELAELYQRIEYNNIPKRDLKLAMKTRSD